MKIVYIDMDDTICDYSNHHKTMRSKNTDIMYPQSIAGFFTSLKPIDNAIDSVNKLKEKYDVYILTRPSYKNPLCYTEKRLWIEEKFGLEFCNKLIICPNKALLMGDYLIDDVLWPDFKGEQIQIGTGRFKTWIEIMEYLGV